MFYEIVVVPDQDMPRGVEWFRVRVADDHVATYFSESFAAAKRRRVLCEDGIPVDERPGYTPKLQAVEGYSHELASVKAVRESWTTDRTPALAKAV